MITKATVSEVIDNKTCKVRIPIFNQTKASALATPDNELSEATICTIPNYAPNVRVGDIVYVGFEDNDYGRPVLLGYLYTDKDIETYGDLVLGSLEVKTNATLPKDTSIGDVKSKELAYLQGLRSNIQGQIDSIAPNSGSVSLIWSNFKDNPTGQLFEDMLKIPKITENITIFPKFPDDTQYFIISGIDVVGDPNNLLPVNPSFIFNLTPSSTYDFSVFRDRFCFCKFGEFINLVQGSSSTSSKGQLLRSPVYHLGIRQQFRSYSKVNPNHNGIDIAWYDYQGEPIYAAANGEVIAAGKDGDGAYYVVLLHKNIDISSVKKEGPTIDVSNMNNIVTRYWHLAENSIRVRVGQTVKMGDIIGLMGDTGNSKGVHLHFETWVASDSFTYQPYLANTLAIDPTGAIWVYGDQIKYSGPEIDGEDRVRNTSKTLAIGIQDAEGGTTSTPPSLERLYRKIIFNSDGSFTFEANKEAGGDRMRIPIYIYAVR